MKRALVLVLIALTLSGYTWGKDGEESQAYAESQAAAPANAADRAKAISAITRLMGTGTPEERQARLNSLKSATSVAKAMSAAKNQ